MQTMVAYIDLNPVRAGIVDDPKDYRFCGYAEALAKNSLAVDGLLRIWADYLGSDKSPQSALQAHRSLIFEKGGDPSEIKGHIMDRRNVSKVIKEQDGILPRAAVLRCRVRCFADGAILGSTEYVRGFVDAVHDGRRCKYPPEANPLMGAEWVDMAVLQSLRRRVFSKKPLK